MAVAQQKQQEYTDKFKAQTPKYKIKDKIWLTLKNIITATKSKKFDTKQIEYTIFEDMGFHNFRLDTPPNIRNVFHVDKLRAASADLFFPRLQMIAIQVQRSSIMRTGPTSMTSKGS